MNISVFGATGVIGRLVVADLLAGGHAVTAAQPTDGKPKGTVLAGSLGRDKVGPVMSRADIAAFLIAEFTDHIFSRPAPAISN